MCSVPLEDLVEVAMGDGAIGVVTAPIEVVVVAGSTLCIVVVYVLCEHIELRNSIVRLRWIGAVAWPAISVKPIPYW